MYKLLIILSFLIVGHSTTTTTPKPKSGIVYNASSIGQDKNYVWQSPTGSSGSGGSTANCDCKCDDKKDCFSSDSLITLFDGSTKVISDLQPGDQLFTSHNKNIIPTQMIMMLDQHRSASTLFHTIITQSGHNISLTALHLLPIVKDDNQMTFVPAKDIQVGDKLRVMMDNGEASDSDVVEIKMEMKVGFYAPLTMEGTLLVNGVLASCYANVKIHESAHFYMGMLRWYDRVARFLSVDMPFGEQKVNEIHVVPRLMYEFGRWFRPSTLLHSCINTNSNVDL